MAGKTVVKGKNAHPFYLKLAEITGSRPKWNFHKYLINRDARRSSPSAASPSRTTRTC
jgi:glutathione peroxidase